MGQNRFQEALEFSGAIKFLLAAWPAESPLVQLVFDSDLDWGSVGIGFVCEVIGKQTKCLGFALDGRGFCRFLCIEFREMLFPLVFSFFPDADVKGAILGRLGPATDFQRLISDADVKGAILGRLGPATDFQRLISPTVARFVTETNGDRRRLGLHASLCKAVQRLEKM